MPEKHGCAHSRFYKTWVTIHHRCYNPNYKDYKNVGGNNIKVCPEWHKDNPKGLENFIYWCEEYVARHKELHVGGTLSLARKKRTDDYSPATCKIGIKGKVECARKESALSYLRVIYLRRLFRKNKEVTITEISAKYKVDRHSIRDALTGGHWSRVDGKEQPLTREELKRVRNKDVEQTITRTDAVRKTKRSGDRV